MELRGRKLVAKIPARYHQYDYDIILVPGEGIKAVGPASYWMRVKHLDRDTLTYDSFVQHHSGVIEPIKRDCVCGLSAIMEEISGGHLQIE